MASENPPDSGRATSEARRGRELYIFLVAADVAVLFIYFFLVPTDVWESQSTRLRSIGALSGSLLSYLGLKLILQRYVREVVFLDHLWFRGMVWFVTPVLWASVLPVWTVQLAIKPPQPGQVSVAIVSQSQSRREQSVSQKSESDIRYRSCESLRAGGPANETDCVIGGLLLRSYEIQVEGAPRRTYLPAASVLRNTFARRAFAVQLPCRLEVVGPMAGAHVRVRRVGEEQDQDLGSLPDDGVLFLTPGPYKIKVTQGTHSNEESFEMECNKRLELQ